MKTLTKSRADLLAAGRWDIDFHLPAEGILAFPDSLRGRIDAAADIAKDKRDPTKTPDEVFQYIDIASIDVQTGTIVSPQDLSGEEAPSRARKVVRAYDIVVSTCRPTRGAIAVVPPELHNQIASTAFSVLRAKPGVNPFYLHYAIRLASTLEQFRKWSTGSSYPAILDEDVEKTLIPIPDIEQQEFVAAKVTEAFVRRAEAMDAANRRWDATLQELTVALAGSSIVAGTPSANSVSLSEIESVLRDLPTLRVDVPGKRGRKKQDANLDLLADEILEDA